MKRTATAGRLPLIVGVAGHRELCPIPGHVDDFRAAIAKALKDLRGASNVPLVILSALAAGADRLVAEVGLEMGCELAVVLPMPKDEYEQDFLRLGDGPESVAEFNQLLRRAINVDIAPPTNKSDGPYGGAGREIARSSHVLLALWDGQATDEGIGGTSWLVHRVLGRSTADAPPGTWPHGAVYQIVVHRKEECLAGQRSLEDPWLSGKEDFDKHVRPRIADYNSDARIFPRSLTLENHYEVSDAMAIQYGRRTSRVFCLMYSFAGISAISLAFFAHTAGHHAGWLASYTTFFVLSLSLYIFARKSDLQNKGQDYRALAEGLRVACAWRLLGIREPVSQNYLLQLSDEGRWIRNALAAFELTADREQEASPNPGTLAALKKTREFWVRHERGYYVRAHDWFHHWTPWLSGASFIGLVLSVLSALALFAIPATEESIHTFETILIVSTASAIIAALCHSFLEKRAWKEHIHRYKRMARLFEETDDWLAFAIPDKEGDVTTVSIMEAAAALRKVSQQELDENGEWLQTHRQRPLEILNG